MSSFSVREGATEVLLIRHADASHNNGTEELTVSHGDLPLSERGRFQAKVLALRLAGRRLAAIHTSHLQRCRETAAAIAEKTALPISIDERLREVEIAGAENIGLHELAEIALARGGWSHLPGTEQSPSIRARMHDAIEAIIERHSGERVAVISHAGAINAYIAALLGLSHDFFFPAGNTSITVVRARENKRLVVTLNDIAHLEYAQAMHHAAR